MSLDKVYLDYIYRDSLEQLAIKSGWIDKELDASGKPRPVFHYPRQSERNMLKSKTLRLITLFKTIDADISGLLWKRFIREGIVENYALMIQHGPRSVFESPKGSEKLLVDFATRSAYKLLRQFKEKFIRYHIRSWFRGHYKQRGGVKETDLFHNYEWILNNLGTTRILDEMPHLDTFASDMLLMKNSLRECIYFYCKSNMTFATGLGDSMVMQKPSDKIKLIEDVYYIAKTQLTDEIIILPEPRTLDEAVEMRNLREMERFRQVLSTWCDFLRHGKSTFEKKLRSDIRKANKELRRVRHWREYKRSPLNFWLSAIGGHIPLFSNIITAVRTVGGLYSKWSERKNNWILLVQSNPRQ